MGFIGLGIMGKPMAANLMKAGQDHSGLVQFFEELAGAQARR
jgi:3-hydroxyisobutyrate dehydrogenase-like beta-hydroxyacid dehydrogenase